jgi:hypothetical protein
MYTQRLVLTHSGRCRIVLSDVIRRVLKEYVGIGYMHWFQIELAMVGALLVACGCAQTPTLPDEPRWVGLDDLIRAPDQYDGEYVIVIGQLQSGTYSSGQYLFFESAVATNNTKHVIYIRPNYQGLIAPDSGVPDTGCENEGVRVYGRFRKWNQYEAMIDNVYRIVRFDRRAPGPLDYTCWSNANADPWRVSGTDT